MKWTLQRWIIHSDAGLAWPKDTPQDKLHEDNHLADQASQHNQDHNVLFSSEKTSTFPSSLFTLINYMTNSSKLNSLFSIWATQIKISKEKKRLNKILKLDLAVKE